MLGYPFLGYMIMLEKTMASIYSQEYKKLLGKLKQARKQAGFTQAQVSKRLNKPQSFVSKVESGERRIDPIELNAFARLYHKNMGFFVNN